MSYQERLITRAAWGAAPARSATYQPIKDTDLTVHWEGPAMGIAGEAHTRCYARVRSIQAYHLGTGEFSDIAYNWVACQHGYLFEGRGPNVLTGANGYSDANWSSKAVCYLGGVGDPFTEDAKAGLRDLGVFHLSQGGTATRWCHRDWVSTACPGDYICPWVKAPGAWTTAPTPTPTPDPEERDVYEFHLRLGGDGKPALFPWVHELPQRPGQPIDYSPWGGANCLDSALARKGDRVVVSVDSIAKSAIVNILESNGQQSVPILVKFGQPAVVVVEVGGWTSLIVNGGAGDHVRAEWRP